MTAGTTWCCIACRPRRIRASDVNTWVYHRFLAGRHRIVMAIDSLCVEEAKLTGAPPDGPTERDPVVDAVLLASRALVAVAARSIAAAGNEVTLPQYRMLVLIAARGPQRPADLAVALDVNPSTASRMCDRLVDKRLVRRNRLPSDRRVVRVALTADGRELVDAVTRHRRRDLARILGRLTAEQRAAVTSALAAFADAADETAVPEADPALADPVLESTAALQPPGSCGMGTPAW